MAYTELFFDDTRLLGRAGTTRVYGSPELVGCYRDPAFSTDYASSFVLRRDPGCVLLALGTHRQSGRKVLIAAVSEDGVTFRPLDTTGVDVPGREEINEVLPLGPSEEPLTVVEDPAAPADERFRLIMTNLDTAGERFGAYGYVLSSPDLLRWHVTCPEIPGMACEPVGGAFWNSKHDCFTVIHRSTWGCRDVGYAETTDFRTFTPHELALRADPLDPALDELYGMPAFPVGGMYVGFLCVYTGNKPSRSSKFDPGSTYPQLAYSWDGRHWQRCLRTSFLPGTPGSPGYTGGDCLFWLSSMAPAADGSLLLYAAHSDEPHGGAFRSHQTGTVRVYRLRENGFMALRSLPGETATVTTREYIYGGGPIGINLRARRATAAILDTTGEGGANVFSTGTPLPGFDHADCTPFSGDSTAWVPQFRGGTPDAMIGKTFTIEIRFEDGELYAISGDLRPLTNTEGARWRMRGRV